MWEGDWQDWYERCGFNYYYGSAFADMQKSGECVAAAKTAKLFGSSYEPTVHDAGACGVVNPFCDAADAAAYAQEGDWTMAALSVVGLIPGAGDALKYFGKYGSKILDHSPDFLKRLIRGGGEWVDVERGANGMPYQGGISGRYWRAKDGTKMGLIEEYRLAGVYFDNKVGNALQDAKDWGGWPLTDKIGQRIERQAQKQLLVANTYGLKMQWVVSNEYKAKLLQDFFNENKINIQVLYVPKV
jgi:hypothetical protein